MLKLKAKYLLLICIFLVCGQKAAFAGTGTFNSYRQSAPGYYIFTDSSKAFDFAFSEGLLSSTRMDELRKQATFENDDLVEAEEYEEISSLRKSTENPALYASPFSRITGESVFHYCHSINFVHKDNLYPCLDRYILLQVFRI